MKFEQNVAENEDKSIGQCDNLQKKWVKLHYLIHLKPDWAMNWKVPCSLGNISNIGIGDGRGSGSFPAVILWLLIIES